MGSPLNYDYSRSRDYCQFIGLQWLGDDFVTGADAEAYFLEFTQEQVDAAMRHMLWHIKFLFTPQSYGAWQRIKIALWFLFGKWKK